MRVTDKDLHAMLQSLPFKQRQVALSIVKGESTHAIRCMSEECNGRIIGHIFKDGTVRPAPSDGKVWLMAYRPRLDGAYGFQCWCGNDSRLAEQEKGVSGIENNAMQKRDFEEVFENLQKHPVNYPKKNGKQEVDGFLIEEISH